MSKLDDLFITFQQNVYPAMLQQLAESLNVTVESIKKLGVGFFPGEQAWVFAERDENGHIIGLLRRYSNGKKFIIEGGKRGLIYECTGRIDSDNKIQSGRPHIKLGKFIRVHDAGMACPLCGKRDWCLLTDDDFKSPSAVICGRTAKGATRYIENSGYLHQFRNNLAGSRFSILPDSNKSVVVVEGATDVLAAMDMGYVAMGKSAAEAGNQMLASLLKGYNVIVVGENDEVGKRGMEGTFQTLKPICPSVIKILPPSQHKDLRAWHPTAAEFETWVQQQGIYQADSNILNTAEPLPLAIKWLEETQIKNNQRLIHYFQGNWYQYDGSCYQELLEKRLECNLYEYFGDREVTIQKKGGKEIKSLFVNEKLLRDIKHALSAKCLIEVPKGTHEPFYIGTKKHLDITRAVVFKNGIYHVDTGKFESLSPKIFITSTLPYNYLPKAKADLWKWFIEDVSNGDDEWIDLLQMWFGYNLIASNHMESMMFLFGVPSSGKSTTVDVLQAMLGADRCCPINIDDLSNQFGLQSLIGKYAMIISEDRTTKRSENDKILQRIKRITGEDWLPIHRKFKDSIHVKPIWRITYVGNEIPNFNDESRALIRRLNLLYFQNNYYEQGMDRTLKQRLIVEAPGVAVWALEGLARLLEQGDFTVPASSKEHLEVIQKFTNPLVSMMEECCETHTDPAGRLKYYVKVDDLYDLHKVWYEDNGIRQLTKAGFGIRFHNAYPAIEKCRLRIQDELVYIYRGIEILPGAFKRYLGGLK